MANDWKDWTPEMVDAHNARVRGLVGKPTPPPMPPLKPPLPESKKRCPTEEVEQVALANWLDRYFPGEWFHVPNGGQRNVVVGKKLKAQGVKPGVPDNFIVRPVKGAPGVIVELKRLKGGVTSPEQHEWINRLHSYGWIVRACKGANEAIEFVRELYGI